jgi:hypothetical protein
MYSRNVDLKQEFYDIGINPLGPGVESSQKGIMDI